MQPYHHTLNGYFKREGEDYPAYDFPEPFYINGEKFPGLEVFHDCDFLEDGVHDSMKKAINIDCLDSKVDK